MPRKKSELVEALQKIPVLDEAAEAAREARIQAALVAQARDFLVANGLNRRGDESVEAWRKRTVIWMKQRSMGLKRFGHEA